MRSPFNNLLGFSDLLIENVNIISGAESVDYLNVIKRAAKNTLTLLDDLLIWAQSQAGSISFSPVKLGFSGIIGEVLRHERLSANSKDISIKNCASEGIEVFADENMLKTVLRNLISNAVKFTNSGGQISVYAIKKEDHVEIRISDNGIGMNEKILKGLFKLTSNPSTLGTAKEKGSGLGLVLCKDFVEKHKGEIWVESVEGTGSDFKFTLPFIEGAP